MSMRQELVLRPGDPMTRLNTDRRARDLRAVQGCPPLDVLVIGGGITGAGVALDAASRGLRVALVERHDLAHGTSRWSSKLIHGGLRYLAKGDVRIAWESAAERARIGTAIAPHLVRPLTQVVPLPQGRALTAIAMRAGLRAADVLRIAARTEHGLLAGSARVDLPDLARMAPALQTEGLCGGLVTADLQLEDDARFVLAVARTAAAYGARILTRVAAEVQQDRVRLTDLGNPATGQFWVQPRAIVNATGVWAGTVDCSVNLAPSRGTHLIVRSSALQDTAVSISVPVPGSFGRFVFTLPQPDGLTFVGLTDVPEPGPIADVPSAPDSDVEWILGVLNTALHTPLGLSDVIGRFAGLRPLLAASHSDSPDLSRRHAIMQRGTLITVTGGKLTAYRRMAEQVVDLLTARPCRTRDLPLIGAGGHRADDAVPARLWRRFGLEAPLVWSYGQADPQLRRPLAPGCAVLGVEVAFARDWEGAASVDDVLQRRTRLSLVPQHAALARPAVARIMTRPGSASLPGAG